MLRPALQALVTKTAVIDAGSVAVHGKYFVLKTGRQLSGGDGLSPQFDWRSAPAVLATAACCLVSRVEPRKHPIRGAIYPIGDTV